jgi:hypothetical protein
MQKTLIDPFELASVLLPTAKAPAPPDSSVAEALQGEPVETRTQTYWVPRGEAWARARCWCSEE